MSADNQDWTAIRWHAGLLYHNTERNATGQLAFSEGLWRLKKGEKDVDIGASFDDLLCELQKANLLLNGPIPSETTTGASDVPVTLAYAVSCLNKQCLEHAIAGTIAMDSTTFLSLTWKLCCAWDGLTAGDIDDLADHIEVEATARGIPLSG